jgi:hypothetical protein
MTRNRIYERALQTARLNPIDLGPEYRECGTLLTGVAITLILGNIAIWAIIFNSTVVSP